jgi:hypothetical protein
MVALSRYPYQPDYLFNSISEIDPDRIRSRWDKDKA